MASWTEMLADWAEGRQEALGMTRRLEAAHRAFTLTGWLVRVLRAIVEPPVATMLHAWHHFLLGCLVTGELVGDDHAWDLRTACEEVADEPLRRSFVPAALHQEIE